MAVCWRPHPSRVWAFSESRVPVFSMEPSSNPGPNMSVDGEARADWARPAWPVPVAVPGAHPLHEAESVRRIGPGLVHALALLVTLGAVVTWLGATSAERAPQVGLVAALVAGAYVGGLVVRASLDQYWVLGQGERAVASVGLTLVPVGGGLALGLGAPLNALALVATVVGAGGYLFAERFRRPRPARLLVLPGGAADWLLAVPEVHPTEKAAGAWDGLVADPHVLAAAQSNGLASDGLDTLPLYPAGQIYERLTARVLLDDASRPPPNIEPRPYYPRAKRAVELLVIGLSLPVTLPLMLGTALAIWAESPGPVLFWQERIGRGGEPFWMPKFRSMRAGNDGEEHGGFAEEDDPRVTRVGRVIRTLRIDELPQFWTVLTGEMSLIGPRPEQVRLAEAFADELDVYEHRHRVRPGITGWAQVLHGYTASEEETRRKLEHDLFYVKHQSAPLDLLIVVLTLKTILTGFGAR